jgi:hypothetical protein
MPGANGCELQWCGFGCGDPRLAWFWEDYVVRAGLMAPRSHLLLMYGGPWHLVHAHEEVRRTTEEMIAISVEKGAQEILIAGHPDCLYYHRHMPSHPNDVESHKVDVVTACMMVRAKHPSVAVHGFVVPVPGMNFSEPLKVYEDLPYRQLQSA